MSAPRVSVILPAFNAATTVRRAIESIRRQTLPEWELIAVDDGSTDGTKEILREIAQEEPRLRLVLRSHEGIVAALNAALALARGELIARMDADDESHPERLVAQEEFLARRVEIGVVGSLVEFGGNRVTNAGYALHVDWINSLIAPEQIALNRFVESPFAHPSVMFRRELIGQHGGYVEGDFPEDYELWLRWLDAGVHMAKVPRVLLTWHDPPARLSRTDVRYSPEAFFRTKAKWLGRWLKSAGLLTEANNSQGKPIFIWGAGRPTRQRAAQLIAHGVTPAGYIDIDAKKTGRFIGGVPVISPDELPPPGNIFVLSYVAKRGARELIRDRLVSQGYHAAADFLLCA